MIGQWLRGANSNSTSLVQILIFCIKNIMIQVNKLTLIHFLLVLNENIDISSNNNINITFIT